MRGCSNAVSYIDPSDLADGVYAASSGNLAVGLSTVAFKLGIPCKMICPKVTSQTKIDHIRRYQGDVIEVDIDRLWEIIFKKDPHLSGTYITHFNRFGIAGKFSSTLCIRIFLKIMSLL